MMEDKFKALMEKKGKKPEMGESEQKAKLSVVEELKAAMEAMMGDKLKDGMMKKVTVAAPSKEGLEMGLAKAKELTSGEAPHPETEEEEEAESLEHEAMESPEEEAAEHMSEEDLDAKIAELMAKKQEMKSKI